MREDREENYRLISADFTLTESETEKTYNKKIATNGQY